MARISQLEKDRIRQKILDVSRTFFFDIGYENTSTKMIAKEVGVAEGTIFNYFPSKTDIFFEAIYDNYFQNIERYRKILDFEDDIVEVISEYLFSSINMMLKLPRIILSELFIQGVKMAKKNPSRFAKMAEMDIKYMKEIEKYFKVLVDKNIIKEVDTAQLSELVYSAVGFEIAMYLYNKKIKKKEMVENIKIKIGILIKGYIKGGTDYEH